MASSIRRFHRAVDMEALTRLYEPPPEYFESQWLYGSERIAQLQLVRLKAELERASSIPFFQRLWGASRFDPRQVQSLADVVSIPQYTVDDIRRSIDRAPPYGDYQALVPADAAREPLRLFFSGGTTGVARPTLYTMWDRLVGSLTSARAYYLAGIRPGDVVLNSWAMGIHNAGANADEALYWWLGALPINTSTGQMTPTARQVRIAADYGAASIITIGDYLVHMGKVAVDEGLDPQSDFRLRGFPGPSGGVAAQVEELWGVPCYDSYGTHEVQYAAAECPARNGLHIFEDAFIIDIVDVDSGEPVADGELGNVVITCLYKTGTSQVRFNTQDLSRLLPREQCACGSWMRRIDHFRGRSDTMVKLRGTNVWPEAAGRVATADPRVTSEYFVVAMHTDDRDEMIVKIETPLEKSQYYAAQIEIADRVRSALGVRLEVELVPVGTLRELTGSGTQGKPKRFEDRRERRASSVEH